MNIQQLRYFIAVVNAESFTKASSALFVSRQALSKSIKQLEAETGRQLLVVADNRVSATKDGLEFLKEIEPVISSFEEVEQKYASPQKSELALSLAQGGLHPMPPDFLNTFVEQEPGDVFLSVEEANSDTVMDLVRSADVEIGILGTHPKYVEEFETIPLAHPGYFVSVPQEHPLVEKTYLELEDIDGQHFVTLGKRNHLHKFFIEQCEKTGVVPDILVASSEAVLLEQYRLESSALVFACSPKEVQPYGDVVYLPLGMKDSQLFGSYAIKRKGAILSTCANHFWEYLKAHELG